MKSESEALGIGLQHIFWGDMIQTIALSFAVLGARNNSNIV